MCDKQNLQISRGACTSSILTSPKREIDRVNQLSELTTCWHKFVPFLVLFSTLGASVSLHFEAREKSLERSAVPLIEGDF